MEKKDGTRPLASASISSHGTTGSPSSNTNDNKVSETKATIGRRLHIGGLSRHARPGWEIMSATRAAGVDHVGDSLDLKRFENDTFEEVYASHVLEHFDHKQVPEALKEWRRVLKPGGRLCISVPNLTVLCKLFLCPDFDGKDLWKIQQMMFGAQDDKWDYHKIGFNAETLRSKLMEAGFERSKIDIFTSPFHPQVFEDTSSCKRYGFFISLNSISTK